MLHMRRVQHGGAARATAEFQDLAVGREILPRLFQLVVIGRLVADWRLEVFFRRAVPEAPVAVHRFNPLSVRYPCTHTQIGYKSANPCS